MSATTAVTGATGFIGRALCETLAQRQRPTTALVRRRDVHLPAGINTILGDLADTHALEQLAAGAEVIIHCAGAVRGRTRADFDRVNVDGTARLLAAAARQQQPPKIVHLSSLAARVPSLSHYAASKAAADALYADYPGPWTVLRPTAVYGPGDQELLPLLQLMARGIGPMPRVPDMRITLIHVQDLVGAILAAIDHPATRSCHELSDVHTQGYSWTELHAAVQAHSGKRVRPLPVPPTLLHVAGQLNAALARLFRYAPMLSPGKARELTHPDWQTHPDDFITATGWSPRIDLATGLRTALAKP